MDPNRGESAVLFPCCSSSSWAESRAVISMPNMFPSATVEHTAVMIIIQIWHTEINLGAKHNFSLIEAIISLLSY